MDRWFKESITDQIKANRPRVWCALDAEGRLVGYYGLSAHSVEAEASLALSRRLAAETLLKRTDANSQIKGAHYD